MINPLIANIHGSLAELGIIGIMGSGLIFIGVVLTVIFTAAFVALKGYCLWLAAKREEKGWFIAILLFNTIGILELFYLYFVVELWKSSKTDSKNTSDTPVAPSSTEEKK